MEIERWSAIDELFSQALELAPEERRTFLDRVCGDDAALRAEVEELLAADERAVTFLEAPAAPSLSPAPRKSLRPARASDRTGSSGSSAAAE